MPLTGGQIRNGKPGSKGSGKVPVATGHSGTSSLKLMHGGHEDTVLVDIEKVLR